MREAAKLQILKIQDENEKNFNRKRKEPRKYSEGELVAIKRTQYGPGLKFKQKFIGPYTVTKVKPKNTYDVQRAADFEGPEKTSSIAEFMQPWLEYLSFGANDEQDGRMWDDDETEFKDWAVPRRSVNHKNVY